jgi:hypothetical protein
MDETAARRERKKTGDGKKCPNGTLSEGGGARWK